MAGESHDPANMKYDNLPLVPWIVAKAVCERPYTGYELGDGLRSDRAVAETERLRQAMKPADVRAFIKHFDTLCRLAYQERAKWFMKCARSQTNRGRDQLYVWAAHQLAGFLARNSRPQLIEKTGPENDGTYCQLYMGPQCVAIGRSKAGTKRAINNAYRNYGRSRLLSV